MQDDFNKPKITQENEVDLGVFLNLLRKLFKKISRFVQSFILMTYNLVIFALIFIKRRLIWLALGGLIGLGFGLQRYYANGPSYFSEMVVRTNFESSRMLYNKIDYFNSLIKQHHYKDLSALFSISESNAQRLVFFEIEPIDKDLEAAKLYRNTFLDYKRNGINGVDTLWTKTMKFEDFKKDLKANDFPLQQIRLYSSNPDIFSNVEEGIVKVVNNNKVLQSVKETTTQIFKDEENILNRSLSGLDSLRQAYNKRIELSATQKAEGNNILVSDKDLRNPEIDLYDKELVVKDELFNARKRAIEQQDILQVYSGFNPVGTKASSYKQDFFTYSWWGILIVFALLLLIELYHTVNKLDTKRSLANKA
jgi:hypothetical protein